jgi:hypothetical protein
MLCYKDSSNLSLPETDTEHVSLFTDPDFNTADAVDESHANPANTVQTAHEVGSELGTIPDI